MDGVKTSAQLADFLALAPSRWVNTAIWDERTAMKAVLVHPGTRQPGDLNCDLLMTQVGEDADLLPSSLPPLAPFFLFFYFYFLSTGHETRHIILAAASQQTAHTLPSSNRLC